MTTMLQRVTARNQTLQADLNTARKTHAALIQAIRDFITDEQHLPDCRCRLCAALTHVDRTKP
jgi:hypothetical protein